MEFDGCLWPHSKSDEETKFVGDLIINRNNYRSIYLVVLTLLVIVSVLSVICNTCIAIWLYKMVANDVEVKLSVLFGNVFMISYLFLIADLVLAFYTFSFYSKYKVTSNKICIELTKRLQNTLSRSVTQNSDVDSLLVAFVTSFTESK